MPTADTSAEPTTILVVDDEDGIRQALNRFLTRQGYRVAQAPDAAAALAAIDSAHPQGMLCDIRMPNMSGVELLPKALAADTDLAIIMLTAIDEPRTAIECLKVGAYDYLIKPVDLDELEVSLTNALRRRQLEIEAIALDALAAARGWDGTKEAVERLAGELGVPADELLREVERRRQR